jgi:purine-binding chemotaxis protein CheW
LDTLTLALPLVNVDRVIMAVAVQPLPRAPKLVLGIINLAGKIIPVFNLRRRLGLPEHAVAASDCFIIAHSATRPLALVVDRVSIASDLAPGQIVTSPDILPELGPTAGIAKLDGELTLIHDLNQFLNLAEDATLTRALNAITV